MKCGICKRAIPCKEVQYLISVTRFKELKSPLGVKTVSFGKKKADVICQECTDQIGKQLVRKDILKLFTA